MEGKGWRYDGKYLNVFGTVPVSHREKYPAGTSTFLYMGNGDRATVRFFLNKKKVEMWQVTYETRFPLCQYDILGITRRVRDSIAFAWK